MTHIKDWLAEPKHRKYIYGIVVALIPVFVATGLLVPGMDQTILLLASALLGLPAAGLAVKNTDTTQETQETELPDEVDESPELLGE